MVDLNYKIKQIPEDFIVNEVSFHPKYYTKEEGIFSCIWIEKRD